MIRIKILDDFLNHICTIRISKYFCDSFEKQRKYVNMRMDKTNKNPNRYRFYIHFMRSLSTDKYRSLFFKSILQICTTEMISDIEICRFNNKGISE